MVARVLESAGYTAIQATNQTEAVAQFRNVAPALVILDLQIDQGESWWGFEQLRKQDPFVPLIAITAWSNQYHHAMQRGIDALMEKPLDLPNLLGTIDDLIRQSEQERSSVLKGHNLPCP